MLDKALIPIHDFIDFNYVNMAFDVTEVDHKALLEKLELDMVNHRWELEGSKYIIIENCDLQGFIEKDDICFDSLGDTYELAVVVFNEDSWFYYVSETNVPIID